MSKKRKNDYKKPSCVISRIQVFKNAIIILCGIFFVCFIISFILELIFGKSFSQIHFPNLVCPSFLRASTILEAEKIIGFTNIFLGLLYYNLDKTMLGLTYSEIMRYTLKEHNSLTIFHIICNLLCIIMSAGGCSEGALLCFLIVLIGFLYQWGAIYFIVVSDSICREMATYSWIIASEDQTDQKQLLNLAVKLAKSFPKRNTDNYIAHLSCFCRLVFKCAKTPDFTIQELDTVWCEFLNNPNVNNDEQLLVQLYNILTSVSITEDKDNLNGGKDYHWVCKVFVSYMGYNINAFVQCSPEKIKEGYEQLFLILKRFCHHIITLQNSEKDIRFLNLHNQVLASIQTNLYIVSWVLFSINVLPIDRVRLKELTESMSTVNNVYSWDMILSLFGNRVTHDECLCEIFEFAMTQLKEECSNG